MFFGANIPYGWSMSEHLRYKDLIFDVSKTLKETFEKRIHVADIGLSMLILSMQIPEETQRRNVFPFVFKTKKLILESPWNRYRPICRKFIKHMLY